MTLHAASKLIKGEARESLLGHLPTAVGANILFLAADVLLTLITTDVIPGDGVVTSMLSLGVLFLVDIVLATFRYGLATIYMNLQYRQPTGVSDLFRGFQENSGTIVRIAAFTEGISVLSMVPLHLVPAYTNAFPANQLITAVLLIVSLAIVAIVVTWMVLTYALVWYVLLDYPDMSWREVLSRSRQLMQGNRHVLLYVLLSLIPLYLVSVFTLGIGALWVRAYQGAIGAAFYRGLINAKQNKTAN